MIPVLEELVPLISSSGFFLAGGTSLALRYGHRFSVDLDFFTVSPFEADGILEVVRSLEPQIIGRDSNTLTLFIRNVKVDFLTHQYPLLAPHEIIEEVTLASVLDVCAMKMNAVTKRGTKKDFFDLSYLLREFSMKELLDFYLRKYPNVDAFTAVRSLGYFDDAETDPDPQGALESWTTVKKKVFETLREL
ncbi:MAG: nucleotidyl transferase AbiEii/AbiGii toxin family protein [Akkermansiaceae bacterium]